MSQHLMCFTSRRIVRLAQQFLIFFSPPPAVRLAQGP